MSQRSPQNARYQKHTKPSGQTRRSAASAKPKRAATSTPAKGSKGSSASRAKFVGTPEYKKWRNIWWGLLGTATVFALAYWPLFEFKAPLPVSYTAIGIAYALLAASIWVDFKKVRPLRIQIEQSGAKKPTAGGAEAPALSKAEAAEARAEARAAEKAANAATHPPDRLYKALRISRWALLGSTIVLAAGSWLIWRLPEYRVVGTAALYAAFLCMAGAIVIDYVKLRPMRAEWNKSGAARAAAMKQAADTSGEDQE